MNKIEIGKLFLVFDENGTNGILEAEFGLDIELSKEELKDMQNHLTEINNIIAKKLNEKSE